MKEFRYKRKMETDQNFVNDKQTNKNIFCLADYSQIHPYQYLKQLNSLYQTCNKSSGKHYSTASLIKLPWKKFKPISVPKCFQESYNLQRKQTSVLRNSQQTDQSQSAQKQKKILQDHKELIKKYYRNNLENENFKKHKNQQRKKHLLSAKSCVGLYSKSSFSFAPQHPRTNQFETSTNKKNNQLNKQERIQTQKTQSNQTHQSVFQQNKNHLPTFQKYQFALNLFKDSSNAQGLIKKRLAKSKYLNEQVSVQQQVLFKLKKISTMPNFNRAKTAYLLPKQNRAVGGNQKLQSNNKNPVDRESFRQSRVREAEYLQFDQKQDLIERYKSKIKQIDCSISVKSIKKTAEILKEMQKLVSINVEDY